jgi:hypothetical protein
LIGGCPLAEHSIFMRALYLIRTVDSPCAIHYKPFVELLQHLEDFDWIEISSLFGDAFKVAAVASPVKYSIIVAFFSRSGRHYDHTAQ